MRDPKISLDINKTRQIAQEIIKVRARYAKGATGQGLSQSSEAAHGMGSCSLSLSPHLPAQVPQGPASSYN